MIINQLLIKISALEPFSIFICQAYAWADWDINREWLCSPSQVTISIEGSSKHLSTCFLAGQPLMLLHLQYPLHKFNIIFYQIRTPNKKSYYLHKCMNLHRQSKILKFKNTNTYLFKSTTIKLNFNSIGNNQKNSRSNHFEHPG